MGVMCALVYFFPPEDHPQVCRGCTKILSTRHCNKYVDTVLGRWTEALFRSAGEPNRSFSKLNDVPNTILCLWNARGNHDRKCEARLKMQMFGFVNRGSKLDLKEICDGLTRRPSLFGRSRLPKARQYNLNVGFVHRNFSKFEIFHGTWNSEEEGPRQCASLSLLGCKNSEVRWEKVITFSHIWGWLKD